MSCRKPFAEENSKNCEITIQSMNLFMGFILTEGFDLKTPIVISLQGETCRRFFVFFLFAFFAQQVTRTLDVHT